MLLAPAAVGGDPWLPPRMPHASFVVGASRSCAHLIYRASAVIIVIAARFDTAILGKSDLPSLTNNIYALEYLFSDLMKKTAGDPLPVAGVFLPNEGNNLALAKAAERHRSQLAERVRVLSISARQIGTPSATGKSLHIWLYRHH